MKFGIGIPTCRQGIRYPLPFAGPTEIVEVTKLAEHLGFDSVWASDLMTPTPSMRIPDGEGHPNWYESLTTMSYLSGVTKSIELGIGVIQIPLREPILLAKQIATVDQFCNGRLLIGVGLGGFRDEYEAMFPKMRKAHRGKILDESLEAISLLLAEGSAPVNFQGKYLAFNNVIIHPKPIRQPPAIYISDAAAAVHPKVPERVAKFGTGLILHRAPDILSSIVNTLDPLLETNGRALADIDLVWTGVASLARTHEEAVERYTKSRMEKYGRKEGLESFVDNNFIGTPEELADAIYKLEKLGLSHCAPNNFAANSYTEYLEQVQMMGEEIIPLFK